MPVITLPELHEGQIRALLSPGRFKALRCGRRWGKTVLESTIACDGAAKGQSVGFFAPDYKILAETYTEVCDILDPIKKSASKIEGVIRTITGGRVDFWTLENDRAGRSRKYHKVLIDEGAFTKPNMMKVWETAIKPSLLDYRGSALVASTPNGVNAANFFYQICRDPKYGFTEFHAPTHTNPFLPTDELDLLKEQNHPLVFQQEYLAEFVDWSGVQFFSLQDLLEQGNATSYPARCDVVYAVLDTAVKTGMQHDGTAVSYWALEKLTGKPRLTLLDWDIVQIEGSLLEVWLPQVFSHLEELAKLTNARMGSMGAFIEDKASGTILLQQAQRRSWAAHSIDSKLTAMGKDERAISVSGYVYRQWVRLSGHAYDKVTTYKQITQNHFLNQVLGFRIGVKDQADDMLDSFCYAVALAFGDHQGF